MAQYHPLTERALRQLPVMTRTHLGEMLTLYRAARRWTVRDVAPRIGISAATLSRIERGHAMDADTMLRIWRWLLVETEQAPQVDPVERTQR